MRELLLTSGFEEVKDSLLANYCIVNSCTVTGKADSQTRNLVRRLNRKNPEAKVIITGCYVELAKDRKIASHIPGVTSLVRNEEKRNINILREEFLQDFLDDMRQIMTYQDSSEFIDRQTIKAENLNIKLP